MLYRMMRTRTGLPGPICMPVFNATRDCAGLEIVDAIVVTWLSGIVKRMEAGSLARGRTDADDTFSSLATSGVGGCRSGGGSGVAGFAADVDDVGDADDRARPAGFAADFVLRLSRSLTGGFAMGGLPFHAHLESETVRLTA